MVNDAYRGETAWLLGAPVDGPVRSSAGHGDAIHPLTGVVKDFLRKNTWGSMISCRRAHLVHPALSTRSMRRDRLCPGSNRCGN
jgi:hypothetical protein